MKATTVFVRLWIYLCVLKYTNSRHGEDLEYIPELGEVVEGFDVTDKTDLYLEDEPVPLAIEPLVLSCIKFKGG